MQNSDYEYKEYARKRNGIEGIPSILRRRYEIDRMPVRGLLRSKMWFGFKIGAINVKRVIIAALNPHYFELLAEYCNQKLYALVFGMKFSHLIYAA